MSLVAAQTILDFDQVDVAHEGVVVNITRDNEAMCGNVQVVERCRQLGEKTQQFHYIAGDMADKTFYTHLVEVCETPSGEKEKERGENRRKPPVFYSLLIAYLSTSLSSFSPVMIVLVPPWIIPSSPLPFSFFFLFVIVS